MVARRLAVVSDQPDCASAAHFHVLDIFYRRFDHACSIRKWQRKSQHGKHRGHHRFGVPCDLRSDHPEHCSQLVAPLLLAGLCSEDTGVRESLRRGFAMVRENWKNVGLMWLVMLGLGIAWIIVSIVAFIITIPLVIVTGIIAAIVAAIPALLLVGVFSLFLSGPLPWIAAGLFVLPLFLIIAFSPWLLLGSWKTVYTSTVWTLTYREIKALPALIPVTEDE